MCNASYQLYLDFNFPEQRLLLCHISCSVTLLLCYTHLHIPSAVHNPPCMLPRHCMQTVHLLFTEHIPFPSWVWHCPLINYISLRISYVYSHVHMLMRRY